MYKHIGTYRDVYIYYKWVHFVPSLPLNRPIKIKGGPRGFIYIGFSRRTCCIYKYIRYWQVCGSACLVCFSLFFVCLVRRDYGSRTSLVLELITTDYERKL